MRHAAAVLIALAAVVGLLDPYACRRYSMRAAAEESAENTELASRLPSRSLPKAARSRLLAAATRTLQLVPAPRGFTLDRESVRAEADERALWDPRGSAWITPGTARAERSFEPGSSEGDAPPVLEQRVFVNSEVTLPAGLASVGGTPRAFAVSGAVGVLVTTIGAEGQESGPGDGGRVALPVSPEQARSALTIVRVLIANSRAENVFRRAIAAGEVPSWAEPSPRRPGEVQSIMVELYGGKADVEALARRLPTAALRRLLDRS